MNSAAEIPSMTIEELKEEIAKQEAKGNGTNILEGINGENYLIALKEELSKREIDNILSI